MKKFLLIIALIISGMGLNARNVTDVANNDSQLSFANIAVEESEIPDDCCELVFNLTDICGDGWNGGSLLVKFNETTENLTIENGHSAAFSFIIPKRTVINLTLIPGQYPSEVGFNVSIKGYVMLNIAEGTYNNNNEVNYEIVVPQRLSFIENSLAEAVGLAEDGETIILTEDLAGEGAVIDKDIVIDFGGHTYSLTEGVGSGTLTSNGIQILQGNNVTLKNGCLKVADDYKQNFYILVQNYANLTIEDMHLEGTNLDKYSSTDQDSYVLSNNSGNVKIIGNTNITANDEGDKAFAFDVCKYANYDAPTISVNTIGQISGNIEVSEGLDSNLNITGGTFTMDVTPWCPYGFACKSSENGTYGVSTAVASGDDVTIDYNGYSLTYTITNTDVFPFECSVRCSAQPTAPTAITIPETVEINGVEVNVTRIGTDAFNDCSSLTSIEIPSSVTTIGEYAFAGCSSLTSIEIPSGVTTIGNDAFNNCSNLQSVTFGEDSELTEFKGRIFGRCGKLTAIDIPSKVVKIDDWAFSESRNIKSIRCYAKEVPEVEDGFYNTSLVQIQVPEESIEAYKATEPWKNYIITKIYPYHYGEYVVEEYEGYSLRFTANPLYEGAEVRLETAPIEPTFITIPEKVEINGVEINVTSIGNEAFRGCSSLTSIEIPSKVVKIDDWAFSESRNIKSIRCYAKEVPEVGERFVNTNIAQIQVPEESIEAYKATEPWKNYTITKIYPYHYGEYVVEEYEGYSLRFTANPLYEGAEVRLETAPTEPTAITIPATVEINGVEINVTSIENEAFRGCSSLTSIEIPSGVTTIGNEVFRNCSSLTSIEIPSGVTTIGEYAFAYCSNIEKLVFEENSQLTTIGNLAFAGCSSLTSIEIPKSVTEIGAQAFEFCTNLVKVAFEENSQLESIGYSAFWGCVNLRSIEIPNSVKSIKSQAFAACHALTSFSFEENSQLVSIGEETFLNADLKSIEIPSSVKEIKDRAFDGCGLVNVTFEENSQLTSLGQSVFAGTPIKEIELPSGLTAISPSAFKGCGQLKSVFIPKNVEYIRNFAFQNCSQLETVIIEEGSKLTSINDLSFSGCNNLQKIVIPSGVTYIGFESFANCNNMTMVECYATDVPQTDSDAFNGCPERMRIQVPAESLEKYQAETPWNNYTLVTEIVRHEIVTSINKEYMGTTEGDGTYFNGESVTVKATAREYGSSWWDENGQWHSFYDNSTFVYWTENGEFVSREQEYTFVAEADRNLQANFMNDNHWTADPGIYSHNMTVWADVQLEGVSANNINIEIGAFCDGELRGNARIQYFEAVDKFMYQLVIYGTNNDNIKFKLYDHNAQKEMEYLSHDYLTFVEDATHGSVGTPKVINFIPISRIPIEVVCNIPEACDVEGAGDYFQGEQVTITANDVEGFLFKNWTLDGEVISTDKSYTFRVERQLRFVANYEYAHVRHLNKGWNWYSTYMQLSGAEGLETVQSALGSAATQIKSQTAFDTYEYGEWIGALDEYYTEKMYMIDINSYYGQDITIKGTPANPSDYTIELKPNWNWVGYPVSYNMSIEEALQNITPMHGDYFKSQTHFSQYYEGAGWLGALQTLEKGQGYMYQNISGETREFVYPNQSNAKSELKSNASLANNYWNANMSAYPTNMSVIAIVENNGMEMSDYEIAAFSNGECRGSARPIYIEQLDVYMTFLTICGEVGETLTFKYYDVASDETYTLSSVITYAANATLGTIDTPYIMSMSTTGINENTYDKVNVYPNPVNVNSELYLETECDNVEIYNALGVRIAEYENVSKIDGIETSGVYVIKVTEQGNVKYNRIVVK